MHLCSAFPSPELSLAGNIVGGRLRYNISCLSRHTAFTVIKAMGVDPQVEEFLAKQNHSTVSYDTLTPKEARSSAVKLLK